MTAPWYLTPPALKLIAAMRKVPPCRTTGTEGLSGSRMNSYAGTSYDRLDAICTAEFSRLNTQRPWPKDAITALLETATGEVCAALFGDPNNLDWAHPERTARRVALAAEIDSALVGIAA